MLDFKAVTIIDPTQADVVREKQRDRIISLDLFCAGKRQTPVTRPRPDVAWMVSTIHEIERGCPSPELSSISVALQILASTTSEGTLADGEKAFTQGDSSVRGEPLYASSPSEGLPGVPEGALIRLDREVYGLVSRMSG